MLNPSVYHKEIKNIVGRPLNHDDNIPDNELEQYSKNTNHKLKIYRQDEAKQKLFFGAFNAKKRENAQLKDKSIIVCIIL